MISVPKYSQKDLKRTAIPHDSNDNNNYVHVALVWNSDA